MNKDKVLLITLNNYPESCNLCRIGLITTYVDSYKVHEHDHFGIVIMKSGCVRHHMANESVELRRGDVYIIPPHIPHYEEVVEPGSEMYTIEFSKEFLQYDPRGEGVKDRLITFLLLDTISNKKERTLGRVALSADDQQFLLRHIERFYVEFHKHREGMFELLNSMLVTIINIIGWKYLYQTKVIHTEQRYRRINKMLQDSVAYIHNHYSENITINDITLKFATSRTTYCTLFKQAFGVTFLTYLNNVRCERAAQLLLENELSLEEIAVVTGFNDSSCLYRNFMKQYGISPGRYRLEHK